MRRCNRSSAATKLALRPDYFAANIPAMVLISLRAYFGRPALIELPELNDDWPIKNLRRHQIAQYRHILEAALLVEHAGLDRKRHEGGDDGFIGVSRMGLEDSEELAELHDLIDVENVLLKHAGDRRVERGQFLQAGLIGDIGWPDSADSSLWKSIWSATFLELSRNLLTSMMPIGILPSSL